MRELYLGFYKKISYKYIHSFHNKYLLSMLAITDNSIIIAFKSIPQYTGRNKHSKSWNCHYLIILTQHLVVFCCVLLHTNYINNLLRIMKIIIINLSFFGKYEAKVFLPSSWCVQIHCIIRTILHNFDTDTFRPVCQRDWMQTVLLIVCSHK